MNGESVRFAINAIINHVNARPASADTVEGIHLGWIQWPGTPEPVAVTSAALEQLERDGFMQRVMVGNRELWRRHRNDSEHQE
jgi:hypothetical protein